MTTTIFSTKKGAIGIILSLFFAICLVFSAGFPTSAFAAEPISVNQCNGFDNVGGENTECVVEIINNLDQATGVTSSTTTVTECHGAANAEPTCATLITESTELVSSVTQCNGSGNGGGGTVTCEVNVINNVVGQDTPLQATVNQCNESGTGGGTEPTILCDPIGLTTNATVTQCNESGTGGGGSLRVLCQVEASTQITSVPVEVNQCNGSGNGGGGVVICSTSLINNVVPAEEGETPVIPPTDGETPVTPPTEGETPVTPPTDGETPVTPPTEGETPVTPPTDEETPVTPPSDQETPVTPPNNQETPVTPNNDNPDRSRALAYTGSDNNAEIIGFGSAILLLGVALSIFARTRKTV